MQFLHLQLKYESGQLYLNVQTHETTQQFQMHNPVSDPEELAYQASLFIGIHLRPFFDLLPVTNCRLSVDSSVPNLIREQCLSELIKLTKTNDCLTTAAKRQPSQQGTQPSQGVLAVHTDASPVEALVHLCDLESLSPDSVIIGFTQSQATLSEQEKNLRLFLTDPDAWFEWYCGLDVGGIYCSNDFAAQFERSGVVLSTLLKSLGHRLIIADETYIPGQSMVQYEKRASDGLCVSRLVQDEQSLIWARWLGVNQAQLGTLKNASVNALPRDIKASFSANEHSSLKYQYKPLTASSDDSLDSLIQDNSIVICEDINIHRLSTWLPQAYFVREVLQKYFKGNMSGIATVKAWESVMRRLIVGSNESTDYDVVVLVRRLEMIAETVRVLEVISFIESLESKTKVHLCGHSDWQFVFPDLYVPGHYAGRWEAAFEQFSEAAILNCEPVFHPCLSSRSLYAAKTGRTAAFFSSFHQLCDVQSNLLEDPALNWLAHQNISNADSLLVHSLSSANSRASMLQKRQSVLDLYHEHNSLVWRNASQGLDLQTPLQTSIDNQLNAWHKAIEQLYTDYSDLFNETLIALNPSVDLGITEELRKTGPDYLAKVLGMLEQKQAS